MRDVDFIYIDGAFVAAHGEERAPLFNPATEDQIGTVRLGNASDVDSAVAAAKRAFPAMARTTTQERIDMLGRLANEVLARATDLAAAIALEYAAPPEFTNSSIKSLPDAFLSMAKTLQTYPFRRVIGNAQVAMQPLGVVAAITPWNSNLGFICTKLAAAVAAGSSMVAKPSEMSGIQTQVLTECLHRAELPDGAFNVVNGRGNIVGAALSAHPDVAKVTFTGSTATGRTVARTAAETFKRVTLELGGKSPTIILDDADLDLAIPCVLASGFINSGQSCIAGTRILAPRSRLKDILDRINSAISAFRVGLPQDTHTRVGPMVSAKQWERVQSYIKLGLSEGASLLAGGDGRPPGFDRGWFVRPTVFADVSNDMRIAREEIFGPVLCVISYDDEDDAVRIANDSSYGLAAYVLSSDESRAMRIAERLEAGRVMVNGALHDPLAPFGGFKHSGIGREFGFFGLEALLEPRATLL